MTQPDALAVRTDAVSFEYGRSGSGVDRIDFTAGAGEKVALLGPNGSGKTTLLRLLAGDLRPASGAIHRCPDCRHRSTRAATGYATDTSIHFDELTGRQNAHWFVLASGGRPANADALLDRFGLAADADREIGDYSFGMRRKVTLIEALAHEPGLLLLDEPTVGLDPAGLSVLGEILDERAATGAAVVFATNDTRIAMRADRVVFLHGGRIVADDSPADLLASVRGSSRIEVELEAGPTRPPALPTGMTATASHTGFVIDVEGTDPDLTAICDAVVRAGGRIRRIDVREPGFDDVFRRLTGMSLQETGSGELQRAAAPGSGTTGRTRRGPPWRRR